MSLDNLTDDVSATDERNRLRAQSQSCLQIEPEAINNGYPRYPRRLAWHDGEAAEDRNDALTKEWMEKWQVECVLNLFKGLNGG